MLANLNHLIVVDVTACTGLFKDGPCTLSLQLVVGEALLLKGRWYCFVFHLCIHHTVYCTGLVTHSQ